MSADFTSTFLVLLSFVVTFALARVLGRNWRQKRADRALQEARAKESRQVRRARERGAQGR